MQYNLTVPAVDLPVTLDDARRFCRVDVKDDDKLIKMLIASATESCEKYTNRIFMLRTYEGSFTAFVQGDYGIPLDYAPLNRVEVSVQLGPDLIDSTVTFTNGTLTLTDIPKDASVTITAVAGYSDDPDEIPGPIKHAILSLVACWYEDRNPSDIPPAILRLLAPYKRFAI